MLRKSIEISQINLGNIVKRLGSITGVTFTDSGRCFHTCFSYQIQNRFEEEHNKKEDEEITKRE
jgi:hypothetical protein